MLSAGLPLATINQMWYSLPLIVVISLVYSATRHEAMGPILAHSARLGVMITGFMAVIMVVLAFIGWQL
jgi:heme/copper-type cytochrome/quinol oxidase subunit 2